MSRVALWSMYNNNTSPPTSINTSPPGTEPQREALNLAESPPPHIPIKRERDHPSDFNDRDFVQPPAKRTLASNTHHLNPTIEERDERSCTPTNNNNSTEHLDSSMESDNDRHHSSRDMHRSRPSPGVGGGSCGGDYNEVAAKLKGTTKMHHHHSHRESNGGTNGQSHNNNNNSNNNNNNTTTVGGGMQFKISSRGKLVTHF